MNREPCQEHPPAVRRLTITRVARLLGVRKWLVWKWIVSEELPIASTNGRTVMLDDAVVHALRVALVPRPADTESEGSAGR